jgi:hypothetical protein
MRLNITHTLKRALAILLVAIPAQVGAQPKEILDALELISSMTSNVRLDKTDEVLKLATFNVPPNLQDNWKDFPAFRKLETAYWAAERTGNGKTLMKVIISNLAQEFESVKYDPVLAPYISDVVQPIQFAPLADLNLPSGMEPSFGKQLLAITQYTDARALGGTRGILQHYFNLPETQIYDILRTSGSNLDALSRGIELASIPPSEQERLKKIVRDLQIEFESANRDAKLSEILSEREPLKNKKGKGLKEDAAEAKRPGLQKKYNDFLRENYKTPGSRDFDKMKTYHEGFGGIILGNQIKTRNGDGKPVRIIWIQEQLPEDFTPSGTLQFIRDNGKTDIIAGVLLEDVYAAYEIVYKSTALERLRTEAIGLTGAFYPDIPSDDRIYDSIIKSNLDTPTKVAVYKMECDLRRASRDRQKANALLRKRESEISKLEKELDEAKTAGNSGLYTQKATKFNELIKEYRATLTKQNAGVATYNSKLAEYKLASKDDLGDIRRTLRRCNKIILHPAVANLDLGRSLIRADILPQSSQFLLTELQNRGADNDELAVCKKWLEGSDSIGWKFTDDQLEVRSANDFLNIARKGADSLFTYHSGILNFNAITSRITNSSPGKTERTPISVDRPEFNEVLPLLMNAYYDYKRLNSFAVVYSALRWGRLNGAIFLNKPKSPVRYATPAYIYLSKEGHVNLVEAK